ncbi:LppU/SCO3897 family protein, partial [Salinispora arenicola]|uniref:LppU/SCO3897 family protein n=1 Tax=Salinispora arenicola TaxID=168697 RepID=UPI003FD6F5E6|nr:hypothetical protein [Salinispora arenicola]
GPPAPPAVPAPPTSPEFTDHPAPPAASAGVSASAAVPLSSRVTPPADQAQLPATPAPQPRVYGRPAPPEPVERAEPDGYQADQQRFGPESPPEYGRDAGLGANGGITSESGYNPEGGYNPQSRYNPEDGFGTDAGFGHGGEDRPAEPTGYAPVVPAPAAPFPPDIPAFADAPPSERPVNGTRPHPGEERPTDRFGGATTGTASVDNTTAFPPPPEPAFSPPAHPPAQSRDLAQPPTQSWEQDSPATQDAEQGRFDAFQPIAEPAAEAPPPKVRNGRVLAAVLVAAVLILAVPLGLLALLGKIGANESAPAFDPAVGSCVKQADTTAVAVDCGDVDAYTVVSKVDTKEQCADPVQPHVTLAGSNRVLCLEPAS